MTAQSDPTPVPQRQQEPKGLCPNEHGQFWPDDYALLKQELAETAQVAERLAEAIGRAMTIMERGGSKGGFAWQELEEAISEFREGSGQ